MTQPYYPNLDGKVNYDVAQGIRTAYDFIHKLTARIDQLEKANYVTRDQAFTHLGPSSVRKQLQVTGSTPLNVTGLAGQLAQPQIADAPNVAALPPITDPLSQDGTLVSLSDQVYRFDGTTDPGTWKPITAGPAPGSVVTSLDTITGAITLVAGTGVTINDNTPSSGDIEISAPGGGAGVSDVDGISGSVTLVAGTNITINDNTPSPGDIRISASGTGVGGLSLPGIDGLDGEDGFGVPGPSGPAGGAGASGPQGPAGFGIDGLDADEPMMIPGATGLAGSPGATGPAGPIGLGVDGLDGEDGMAIPGPQGPSGGGGGGSISAWFPPYYENGASNCFAANAIRINMFNLPASITTSQVTWRSNVADASGNYSIGIYNSAGTLVLNTATFHVPASNTVVQSVWVQGATLLAAGTYFFAFTGTATTGAIYSQGSGTPQWLDLLSSQIPAQTSAAGVLPGSITIPALTGSGAGSNHFCWVIN